MTGVSQTIDADWGALARALEETPERLDEERRRIVMGGAQVIAGELTAAVMGKLAKDPTGDLARSQRPKLLVGEGPEVEAIAGSELPYAEVQDQGDPQHGINGGKKMAVPLSFGNVPRGKSPSDWGDKELMVLPRKGKDSLLVLAEVSGRGKLRPVLKSDRIQPKYVLKDSVNIKGVHYVDAAAASSEPLVNDYVAGEIEEVIGAIVDETNPEVAP